MAAAAGWPVVFSSAGARPTTLRLEDVPWDAATQTFMDMSDLRAIRFGDVWIVTTRASGAAIEALDTPFVQAVSPRRSTASRLAALLEGATSAHGVVVVNARLGSVVFADRNGLISRYADIVASIEGTRLRAAYSGSPVDLSFHAGELQETLALLADVSGLNVVADPGIRKPNLGVRLAAVPWDNALDAILRLHGLKWSMQGNLLKVFPPRDEEAVVVNLELRFEDPRFFLPFAKCLTPAGTLRADELSRALVVRDIPERVRWFQELVELVDVPAPR
jgi:type II secretory pathway component HofQ